jgi:replicative DNA helicase
VSDDNELIGCPQAEMALLGAALLAPHRATEILDGLAVEDFTDPRCAAVFPVMQALVRTGTPPDPVVVLGGMRASGAAASVARSRDPGAWLHDLAQSAPVPDSASHYRAILLEHSYRRAVAKAAVTWAQVAGHAALDELDGILDHSCREVLAAKRRRAPAAPTLSAVQGGAA